LEKTRPFVYNFGGVESHFFKDSFSHPPIRVWRNLKTLHHHMKNDHKEKKGKMLAKRSLMKK
jgi:hypothetical protein